MKQKQVHDEGTGVFAGQEQVPHAASCLPYGALTPADNAGDEHGHAAVARSKGWGLVALSFSALGIIYGDIGTRFSLEDPSAGCCPRQTPPDSTSNVSQQRVKTCLSCSQVLFCAACTAPPHAGTSPLYAYQAVFSAAPAQHDVLAAASLFFWTLTLIVLLKYVGIIIRFDDNGEGASALPLSETCGWPPRERPP